MGHQHFLRGMLLIMVWCIGAVSVSAQELVVPDLTGLNIPQAAAQLNRVGLALGSENAVAVTEGVAPDIISGQSIAAGEVAAAGATVDVQIPRTSNVRIVYDDNDLTVINLNNASINIEDVVFETVDSTQSASFNAGRWGRQIRAQQCTQIWSVNRNGPKDLTGCRYIQNWLTTTDRSAHFWTAAIGVQTFRVVQGDAERATCQAAPANSQDTPIQCEFYLPAGNQGDKTSYIYLAYRADRFAVINNSKTQWMPVNTVRFINGLADPAPLGQEFRINAPLFGRPDIVARINRLAPNQCLLFISSAAEDAEPLQNCDIIATYPLQPSQLWWTANFEVQGADNRKRLCKATTPDKLTLCVMSR